MAATVPCSTALEQRQLLETRHMLEEHWLLEERHLLEEHWLLVERQMLEERPPIEERQRLGGKPGRIPSALEGLRKNATLSATREQHV